MKKREVKRVVRPVRLKILVGLIKKADAMWARTKTKMIFKLGERVMFILLLRIF